MSSYRYSKMLGLTVAAAPFLVGAPARAQLDEVVVTAQKRTETLQEVPVSIAAFDEKAIRDSGILRVEDFGAMASNVMVTTGNSIGITQIAIRGVSTETSNIGLGQAIPVYVDGVPQGRGHTVNNGLYDVEGIEVLRGPQGTLFGQNSTGGAVLIRTKRPDLAGFSGSVRGTFGNKSLTQGDGMLNVPFAGNRAALRLSVSTQKMEGFDYNTTLQSYVNDLDSQAIRGQVLYKPTDALEILLRADYTEDNQLGPSPDFSSRGASDPATRDRLLQQNVFDTGDRRTHSYSGEINYQMGFATLTSVTAYQAFDYFNFNDVDRGPTNLLNTTTGLQQNQFSQELRLASRGDGAAVWVAGLFYFEEDSRTQFTGGGLAAGNRTVAVGDGRRRTRVLAPFGQVDWRVADRWIVTVGARYTRDDKDATRTVYAPFFTNRTLIGSADDKEFSGTLRLQYRQSDRLMFYGGYSRGFKGSGFNIQPGGELDFSADPEFVDSYEIGMRSEWADGRVRLNATAFNYKYTDLQRTRNVQNPVPGGLPILVFDNAGDTASTGIEADIVARPIPSLDVGASFGYCDAEFKRFNTFVAGNPVNAAGNIPSRSPKNSAAAFVQYRHEGWSFGNLTARADYNYRSAWFDTDINTPERRQEAVGVVNARLALQSKEGAWGVTLWGRNLSDEIYESSFTVGIGPGIGRLHAPGRQYGVEITASF